MPITNKIRLMPAIAVAAVIGASAATAVAPTASAAPDCSAAGVSQTVSTVTGSARDYLNAHPDADQAVTAAASQPQSQASGSLRSFFTAHPSEYYDLRAILEPIGTTQQQCHVTALPPDLATAYGEFMAG